MTEFDSLKIKELLSNAKTSFIYVAIFSCLINILMLTVPLYMLQIFDRVLASQSFDTLLYLTLIAMIALAVLGLLDIARSRILVRVSRWIDNRLSPFALARSADETLSGSMYGSQSLNDISTIRTFLSGPSIFSLFDAPWTPLYLLVIFLLHPLLGGIATIGAILIFCLAVVNELTTRGLLAKANTEYIKNQQRIDKTLNNAEVIQAMGMMPNIVHQWFEQNEKVLSLQGLASDKAGMILSTSKFIRLALQLGILGLGAYLVVVGGITPGVMIAASIVTSRALAPIEQSIGTWKQMKAARRSYDRLKQYLEKIPYRGDSIELPKPKGKLAVENLAYIPPGTRKPIVHGINFTLNPGESLALIGPSGSGKSTLARLMLGIWRPFSGAARLDGANVFEWNREQLGTNIGYLPQDVELFYGTIKENIARMSAGDDEKVIAAAKMAGAHEMILKLPKGYDFNIGGFTLSGGQKQRIALARVFYGEPKLIVLDEPNASLDQEGDEALHVALNNARKKNMTMVLISHRPNIVKFADYICIMAQGSIKDFGKRDEVLQRLQKAVQATSKPAPAK